MGIAERCTLWIDKMSVATDKNVFGSVFAILKENEYNNKTILS